MINEFLNLPTVFPYVVAGVIAVSLLVIFALLTAIGAGFDADFDFDGFDDIDAFTRWMGVKRLPISVILTISFILISVIGLVISLFVYRTIGMVPGLVHVPIIFAFVFLSRFVFRLVGKVWPDDVSTTSFNAVDIIGKQAIVHEAATAFRVGSIEINVNGEKMFLNVLAKDDIVEVGRTVTIYDYRDSFYIVSY